eukprot:CAMPEP_0119387502 /NCGR_PEP_ID=MMETSP1334-20130426/100946_1 /TAXON_ID=127549 /ORGANISM="Calcidiscus leptoporus, Strain RCC1130" /LENGTH=50 /DNA_ID=CAMNT_0007409259 /DNA_START=35 /DNA_END=183 /DNA_ORIENTATION=+
MYVVNEVCGFPTTCRNVLCVPHELVAGLHNSPILDLAVRSGAMTRVVNLT